MTNEEKHQSAGDEEYQYPNEEYVTETAPPEPQEPPQQRTNFILRAIQNNKRITIVIVVAIVALIAFKFMSPNHHKQKIIAKKKPVAQQAATSAFTPPQQPSPEMVNQLSSLQQQAQENQTAINQLRNQITDLRAQLAQAHVAQTQLNQSMVVLVEQLKQLTTQIHRKPVKKAKKIAPPPPPLVFHLKAVVPGRAWIVSNNGLSESVSVGDTVPQYGVVKVVDANRGMVLTSSGKVIGYGIDDH